MTIYPAVVDTNHVVKPDMELLHDLSDRTTVA
jgi:hypothetical protein